MITPLDPQGQNLPQLCDEASRALDQVKTLPEVLEIRNFMEAARAYARKHHAARRAQSLACKIVILAERRIARELAVARQRGQIAAADGSTHHRPVPGEAAARPPTLKELGLSTQTAFEFRKYIDLSDEDIERVHQAADADGRVLVKADFARAGDRKNGRASRFAGPRRPLKPSTAQVRADRPPWLSRLGLWVTNGMMMADDGHLHNPTAVLAAAAEHGVMLDPQQLTTLAALLDGLAAAASRDDMAAYAMQMSATGGYA